MMVDTKALAAAIMRAGLTFDEAAAIADAVGLPQSSPELISPVEGQPQKSRQD
jgi:hypothetical protein